MRFLIALMLLSSTAWAGDEYAACHFTTECFETDACADTDFRFAVTHDDDQGFVIQTDAENIGGLVFDNRGTEAASTLIGQTDTAYHMLTINPDGAARYTVHMEGPMTISYAGQCEVPE